MGNGSLWGQSLTAPLCCFFPFTLSPASSWATPSAAALQGKPAPAWVLRELQGKLCSGAWRASSCSHLGVFRAVSQAVFLAALCLCGNFSLP